MADTDTLGDGDNFRLVHPSRQRVTAGGIISVLRQIAPTTKKCGWCLGLGRIGAKDCNDCEGQGFVCQSSDL